MLGASNAATSCSLLRICGGVVADEHLRLVGIFIKIINCTLPRYRQHRNTFCAARMRLNIAFFPLVSPFASTRRALTLYEFLRRRCFPDFDRLQAIFISNAFFETTSHVFFRVFVLNCREQCDELFSESCSKLCLAIRSYRYLCSELCR